MKRTHSGGHPGRYAPTRFARWSAALAAVWLTAGGLAAAATAEVTVVRESKDPWTVYLPINPAPQEKTAAAELAAYLGKISGAAFAVKPAPNPLPAQGLFVGKVEGAPSEGLVADAFRIRVQGQRAYVIGGKPIGTLYGVYALLERIGCRWWSFNEEDVPALSTITLPEGDTTVTPPFAMHLIRNNEAMSPKNNFYAKLRSTGWNAFTGSHTLYGLLGPYAEKHPEIYPDNGKGVRKGNRVHFCYSATNIVDALVEAIEKEYVRNKGDVESIIYHAGMGDTGDGMCLCPTCRAIYKEEMWTDPDGKKKLAYTATLLRMINRTAAILEARHPGIRVGTFAYMSLEAPPAKTVPGPNVIIRVPRLRHCSVHPAETCPLNRSFKLNLERWCQLAPGRVYVWEYGVSFGNFMSPFPCLYSMSSNLNYYARLGVKGVEIQGDYTSPGSDRAVLKNYVWSKIFWNPDLDPHLLVREFCKGYYGPAAEAMVSYVDRVESSVIAPSNICASEFSNGGALMRKAKAVTDLRLLAAKAAEAAGEKEPYYRRVREATIGLDVSDLWGGTLLLEKGDMLVRQNSSTSTYARALEIIPYMRGGGATEWSSGTAAQFIFLTQQGGPLVKFAHGPLKAQIAPVMNGMIRRLIYADKDLLQVSTNDYHGRYPMLDGSMDTAGATSTRMMKMVGEPTPTEVKMEGWVGVGLFGGQGKYWITKTVTMADDGALVTRIARRPEDKDKGKAKTETVKDPIVVTSVYTATTNRLVVEAKGAGKPPKPAAPGQKLADAKMADTNVVKVAPAAHVPGLRVECQGGDGAWRSIELVDRADVAVPTSSVWRITLPEQGCVVTDHYMTPGAAGGTVKVDLAAGTLTTVVRTIPPTMNLSEETPFYERRLDVAPLKRDAGR